MPVPPVARPRDHALERLFGRRRGVVVGVVHALPLPGSPEHDGRPVGAVYDRAVADAEAYAGAGLDGLIVENHGDVPFLKPGAIGPETAAFLAVMTERVRRATGLPVHDIGPMRAFRRAGVLGLDLRDRRFGYPLELLIAAGRTGWRVAEVDVAYHPRAAGTRSKVTGTVRGTARAIRDMAAVLAR